MAAVSVGFDGTRVDAADSVGTVWVAAGGATPAAETDFAYQNGTSMSAQVKTTESGFGYFNNGTTRDMTTPQVWIAKAWNTNYGILDGNGFVLEIGSGASARLNYYRYYIYSASTYPISGGWLIVPIDPNISGYRSQAVNTPSLNAVSFFGIRSDFSAQSKTANVGLDAIDIVPSGSGLTLTGGDGADADGTFQNFITFDEGTTTNRYGIVTTREGILYITGVLTIGTSTATVFTDSNQTLVFPNGRFNTGFCGIDINLGNTGSLITFSSITMIGRGQAANDGASADTRPDFTVTGTTATNNSTFDACTWTNFRNIDFTSKCAITDSTFNRCLSITLAQATIDNCTIEASPVAANVACVKAVDPTDITNCTFIAGAAGHAIEITSATGSPFAFVGNTFSGYAGTPGSNLVANSGDNHAAIYNNTGAAITINVTNGTNPTVRNGAGATTTVNNNINVTVTVQDAGANPIVGAQVAVYKTSDNSTIIASTTTNSSGIVTGTAPASTGPIYIRVRQSNTADATRYYPNSTVGTIGTGDFSVTITMTEDMTVT